jgi:xanthine/uracil permease
MGPCNPAVVRSAGIKTSAGAIDQVEGLPQLFLYGLQHVLVMCAGTVAVPLINLFFSSKTEN